MSPTGDMDGKDAEVSTPSVTEQAGGATPATALVSIEQQQQQQQQQQQTSTATSDGGVEEAVENVVQQVVLEASSSSNSAGVVHQLQLQQVQQRQQAQNNLRPKKKRLCRYPGCTKVIKSQGHCQRHGAKAKRCKVEGCDKQAQGTHEGMCKRHWKQVHFPPPPPKPEEMPPPPQGESVYDQIIPASISYRPPTTASPTVPGTPGAVQHPSSSGGPMIPMTKGRYHEHGHTTLSQDGRSEYDETAAVGTPGAATAVDAASAMPLVAFLSEGMVSKEAGWHRNSERRARGMFPVASLASQLEPWERQLALMEILLLSGGTPQANFRDLAHAWGREKGFHTLLCQSVCERRGEVERKKRSDAGKTMSQAERDAFRAKLKRTRVSGGKGDDSKEGEEDYHPHQQQQQQQQEELEQEQAQHDLMADHDTGGLLVADANTSTGADAATDAMVTVTPVETAPTQMVVDTPVAMNHPTTDDTAMNNMNEQSTTITSGEEIVETAAGAVDETLTVSV